MEKKVFPSELQDRFLVRLPDGMRDQIAESAKANNRSMNAEIVLRLQGSYQTSTTVSDNKDVDLLMELAEARKETAEQNSGLAKALAQMLLVVTSKLTADQREAMPTLEVIQTFAKNVVGGQGPALQAFINFLGVGKLTPISELNARNTEEAKRRLKLDRGRDKDSQSAKK